MPHAWKKIRLFQLDKISGAVTISVLNALWPGHGILRTSPMPLRLAVVFGGSYLLTTVAELMWLIHKGPKFTGFESPTRNPAAHPDSPDALVEELGDLPPADLREEALELAKAMKSFEAGTDREFVNSLAIAIPAATDAEKDEVLDKQSAVLMEHNLSTWRAYRDQFYRPARAFRDEMRKRLGIRNVNSEPRIPALDEAVLTGAKPITQAANYLAGLARRLR
ncbi:MAG TPA: hypothetical protein VGG76_10510 [Gemmatimonadaceae bacterium]